MAEKVITWQEFEKHVYYYDCWVLVAGLVYNVTDFLVEHPGGDAILLKHSGRDGTPQFEAVPHSEYAISLRNARLVGKIESSQPPEGYLDRISKKKKQISQRQKKKLVVRTDKISREEVQAHKSEESCWIIMNKKVYDVTDYLEEHPGGVKKIMTSAGSDATKEFVSQIHSEDASRIAEKYFIGELDTSSSSSLLILIFLIVVGVAGAYCLLSHS